MKIYYDTKMKKMPSNCSECNMFNCNLPAKRGRGRSDELRKAYTTRRHRECPLVEVVKEDG